MKAMKNSGIEWIGEIPAEWEVRRLKSIGIYRNGLIYQPNDLSDEISGTLVLRSSNIQNGILTLNDNVYVNKEIPKTLKVKKGDILICSRNGSRELVGKNAIIDKDINASFGAFMMIFRCENPRYIYYILNSDIFKYYLGSFFTSTINQLTGSNFGEMRVVYCPDLPPQTRIAEYLDKKCGEIDKSIALQRRAIEKLKEYKQSLISKCVTGKLSINSEPNTQKMKNSGIEWIGEIPVEWEVCKLKQYFNFGKGLNITKENLIENGIAVISYGQIHSKTNIGTTITNDLLRFVSENYLNSHSQSLVNKGDFIFADTSEDIDGVGNCVFIDREMILFAGYHSIILKNKNADFPLGRYLSYLFKTNEWRSQLRTSVSGIKVFSVTQKILKDITFILPPKPTQTRIAKYLDKKCGEIDAVINGKEQVIEKLDEYKKSLIYECVTGKMRV